MRVSHFDQVPVPRFLIRTFPIGLVVLGVSISLIGPISQRPLFYPRIIGVTGYVAPELPAEPPSGKQFYQNLVDQWQHSPAVCQEGQALSDFQRGQCALWWERIWLHTALGAMPLLAGLIALLWGVGRVRVRYREAHLLIQSGKAAFQAKVSQPATASSDLFSWYFCLRPIAVTDPTGRGETVYLPLSLPIPLPGEALLVFEGPPVFGQRRLYARLHAPHLAILSGGAGR